MASEDCVYRILNRLADLLANLLTTNRNFVVCDDLGVNRATLAERKLVAFVVV
jgi:hypothetical protein